MNRPMALLLVEDDKTDCDRFVKIVNDKYKKHVRFIDITDSSTYAVKSVIHYMPDGVILDLELHKGEGSGIEFLKGIENVDPKPIIVVTTNTPSNLVYNLVRDMGVDFVYYKRQKTYNPEIVISNMLDLWAVQEIDDDDTVEKPIVNSQEDIYERIKKEISNELDLLGVGIKYKGREYIQEAVFLMVSGKVKTYDELLNKVSYNAGVTYPSVIRAIQTAIFNTWDGTKKEIISKYYTAPIDVRIGVPSPTEFIHFYVDKISSNY